MTIQTILSGGCNCWKVPLHSKYIVMIQYSKWLLIIGSVKLDYVKWPLAKQVRLNISNSLTQRNSVYLVDFPLSVG